MNSISKHDIEILIEKSTAKEPLVIKKAIRLTLFGYILTLQGIVLWGIILFGVINPSERLILTFAGSFLLGAIIFLDNVGYKLYFEFHNSMLPIHTYYKAIFRTFNQFYHWGSYLIIFLTVRWFIPEYSFEYFLSFLILSTPAILGYPLFKSKRIYFWFENLFVGPD